jgi:hypothetical protein
VPNMTFKFLPRAIGGGLMLVAHTPRPPNDVDWEPYYDEMVKQDPEQLLHLVFTDGGAPSGAQRKRVNEYLQGRASRAAVITTSTMVHGVVTALGWFNSQIRTYSPKDLVAALKHLDMSADEAPRLRPHIQDLRRRLDYPQLKCIVAD